MRLAALDIGNSAFHLGLLEQGRVQCRQQLPVDQGDRLADWLEQELHRHGAPPAEAVICSVVPQWDQLAAAALRALGCRVVQVQGDSPVGLANRYLQPCQLGPDRLVAALGAYRLAGGPVVVADVGTAITVDAVSGQGEFLGGAILLGPHAALGSLQAATALLTAPERLEPALPGRSTEQCLAAGAFWGAVGAIREIADHLRQALGAEAPLLLTGGGAASLAPGLPGARLEPDLVLVGLWHCWQALR